MKKAVIVIPTYNEKDNVRPLAEAVRAATQSLADWDVHLLFVDDNSPDGTGALVDALAAADAHVACLHRAKKEGLGRAYVAGFRRALAAGADRVVQMDCDFSHDPAVLPRLLATDADLVIGSRYVKGGATPGWPLKRRLISRAGGLYIRLMTGMPVNDPTGGYKCWRAEALRRLGLETIESAGYSFQLEMNHRAWRAGCSIREIPIVFPDRQRGESKITPGIAAESLKIVWKLKRI
mgnify:FL=1